MPRAVPRSRRRYATTAGTSTETSTRAITASGHTGTARIQAGQIHVTVTGAYTPVFLSSIGVGPLQVTGTGQARLVRAQNGAER